MRSIAAAVEDRRNRPKDGSACGLTAPRGRDRDEIEKRAKTMRTSGVLMHISSLPGPYGIGTMGDNAYRFVDFLQRAGQTWWQILPIGPTSYGDSPYQSFSSVAGNPYFIDLPQLERDGLLERSEYEALPWCESEITVDYGRLYELRYRVLHHAYRRFTQNPPEDYRRFCEENVCWLPDYALFMALKDAHGGRPWNEWEQPLKVREPAAIAAAREQYKQEIGFQMMLQYLFTRQWRALKGYANERGIRIIGDIPIYVPRDSADVWSAPEQFLLDEDYEPIEVAGCPPDGFSADGQLWGNPLFRWEAMRADGYRWWIDRFRASAALYDVIRIDHFRGFESYYAIPGRAENARGGVWRQGPGMELFHAVRAALGDLPIIAEDLGFLTEGVHRLREECGFPGMKVLQFAFDSREDSDYLPHNYCRNCVVYTGTHDNDTIMGWMDTAAPQDVRFAWEYLRLNEAEGPNWGMMCGALQSPGDTVILTMQDLLGLGSEARMNTPSTLGCNWKWRAAPDSITPEQLAVMKEYGVTRISINPQTMNDETLRTIGRAHNAAQVKEAFAMARQAGFDNINMDLIAGLPGEDLHAMKHTLEEIRALAPESLTVHSLAIKRAANLNQQMDDYKSTIHHDMDAMHTAAQETAQALGMEPYYLYRQKNIGGNLENVGYAKPACECIYNILIMEEMTDIIAAGAGASTKLVYHAENRVERVENCKSVDDYISRFDEMLDRKRKAF